MDGSGAVNIPVTGALNITGSVNFKDRTINNSGTTTWTGAGNINSGQGAVFNNLAGATFDVRNDRSFRFNLGGDASVFNNLTGATFRKSAGAATTTMNVSLQNDGTVDVDTGTLNITRAGASTSAFDVATGATLKFSTNYTANKGTAIIGAGSTQLTSGTFSLGATATGVDAVTALNLVFAGGTLGGTGDLTIDAGGVFTWSGGTMDGGGAVNIPATGALNITGEVNFKGRTINNSGTTTWTGTGHINSGQGAVFNNLAGATFDVRNDRSFRFNLGGDASVFNNLTGATFRKTVAEGTTTMALFFNNTGTIDVQTGTVNFTGGGTGLP